MTVLLILLAVAAGLLWWVRHRSARLRREAESREAQVLEALFAARRAGSGNGGETIDVDRVFGREAAAAGSASSADAVLRAAGIDADLIALVKSPAAPPRVAAADPATGAQPSPTAAEPAVDPVRPPHSPARSAPKASDGRPTPVPSATEAADEPVPVRDLVQTFYEARGYQVVTVARAARPIELILRHKSDPSRSYAFAPIAGPVSEAGANSMREQARSMDLSRVLIATDTSVAPELAEALLAQGVRVLDATAIEAQLARIDSVIADKIRAAARQRAARRRQSTLD